MSASPPQPYVHTSPGFVSIRPGEAPNEIGLFRSDQNIVSACAPDAAVIGDVLASPVAVDDVDPGRQATMPPGNGEPQTVRRPCVSRARHRPEGTDVATGAAHEK